MFIALCLLTLIASILFLAFARLHAKDDRYGWDIMRNIAAVVAPCAMIGAILCGLTVVPAGARGVVVLFGNVDDRSLPEGLHLVNPLSSVEKMTTQVQRAQNKYVAETADTQSVTVSVQMNWRPDADAIPLLFRNYGMKYAETIIDPAINECLRAEIAKHKVTEVIGQRPAIRSAVQSAVAEWIARHHLALVEMAITDIDFSEIYDKAIEEKQIEEQKAAAKLYELKGVQTEAEKVAAKAKGEADALRVAAQAEADTLRIRGEAQSDYNKRVAESLTPMLIDRMRTERWDGKLPIYMFGDSIPMIQVEKSK